MKDLGTLLQRVSHYSPSQVVMATLVSVSGSAYRSPGARMLITAEKSFGAISGGCLESDIETQAREVLLSGVSRLVTYDALDDADLMWGLGTGCGGVAQVLIERLEANDFPYWQHVCQQLEQRHTAVLLTLFQDNPSRRLLVSDQGVWGDVPDCQKVSLQELALAELAQLHKSNRIIAVGRCLRLPLNNATISLLVEPILPPPQLVIIGAGYDALPIVNLAADLAWCVLVQDHRLEYARSDRFIKAAQVQHRSPKQVLAWNIQPARSAVLVMTHNFARDLEALTALAASPPRYLGVLGPRSRTERLLAALREQGVALPELWNRQLYSPMGLDIGAETPEEIGLAIVAELRAVFADREGGMLRNRSGPIHDR